MAATHPKGGPVRAGTYQRISDDRQGEGLGVGRQEKANRSKAEALHWPVVETYTDNDISASSGAPRPDYDRLMSDLEAGTINAVVVYDLDRLTRKPAELETFIDLVDRTGALVANVSGEIDLLTANGRMLARFKGAIARQEAERIAERVRAQQRQAAEAGRKHQGKWRVFGYERDFTVNEAEAKTVREVFKRKAAGESLTSLALWLNGEGITTTGGGHWDASKLSGLIKRRDYIGEITIRGEVVGAASFEPIVDRAVWTRANEQAEANNRRGTNARKGLLSGFLVCGNCLNKMKRGGNRDGYNYRCPGKAVPGTCGSCSITGAQTDLAVFNAVWRKEQDGPAPTPETAQRDYRAEEAALEAEIAQAHAMREAGQLALVDAVTILSDLRTKLAKVQREEAANTVTDLGHMQLMLDWDDWTLSQQRLWLDRYVSYVVVAKAERVGVKGFRPDRLEVHYTDGTVERLKAAKAPKKEKPKCAKCDKDSYGKGLCETHYKAAWRAAKRAEKA